MSLYSSVKDKVIKYIELNMSLLKLNVIGRTSSLMSYFMFALICLFVFFCIIMFLGFGLVQGFVTLGMSAVAAFFAVTGIYMLLLVLFVVLRRSITTFFADTFVQVLTDTDKDDDDDKKGEDKRKTTAA